MTTGKLTAKLRTVHAAVQSNGIQGVELADLREQLAGEGMSCKTLFQRLSRLKKMHLVEQRNARGQYFALELADVVTLQGLRDRCLALVEDCPRGVSDAVLAAELQMTESEVWRAMQPALKAGTVVRVAMPPAHGGGKGFAVGGRPAEPLAPAAPAALAMEAGAEPQAAGAFELIDNSRLAIAWSGARVVLPAEVTRGLFRYLDALGGVQTCSHLQGAQGGAP